jgi:hypothetical protein
MINYGKEIDSDIKEASAIIAQNNTASRLMMEKNRFHEIAKWNYYYGYKDALRVNIDAFTSNKKYSFDSSYDNNASSTNVRYGNKEVSFASLADTEEIVTFLSRSQTFVSTGRRYVHSWKWYELDLNCNKVSDFITGKRIVIIRTEDTNKIEGLAITNNNFYENQHTLQQQLQYNDQERKSIASIEGADDNSSTFQIVYLDVPSSTFLETLLVFIINIVISSNKYNRIQVFAPNQVHLGNHQYYDMSDELAKFGIRKSECFLLYNRSI